MPSHLPARVRGAWLVRAPTIRLGAITGTAYAAEEIHWTMTGPAAVAFDWRGADSTIDYGPTAEYGLTATAVPPSPMPVSSPGPFWEARITGLPSGTEYHYSIEGGADHRFRTVPAPSQNFVAYVEGDSGDAVPDPAVAAVQAEIGRDEPWFVLMVGDLTYANDHGPAAVERDFNAVMAWSLDAACMPVWGNHEWNAPDDFRSDQGRFSTPVVLLR
jgi:phosphodiesterase/alkaline phosphatase D-like protein